MQDISNICDLNKAVASSLTKFFSNGSGEFVEELAQQIISPAISELSFKGNQGGYEHPVQLAANAAYSAFVSFFAGGIGGTVSESMQGVRTRGNAQADGKSFVNLKTKTDVKSASANIALSTDMNVQHNNAAPVVTDSIVKKLADLTGQFNKVRSTGETLGVSDRNIRTAQDLALLSHRDVVFTDGLTGINEDGSIQINKDSTQPMNEVAEMMIGKGLGEVNIKQTDNSQKKVDDNSQKFVHTYESLNQMTDEQVRAAYENEVNRYAETLKKSGFNENQIRNYIDEAMKIVGVEDMKTSIIQLQGENVDGNTMMNENVADNEKIVNNQNTNAESETKIQEPAIQKSVLNDEDIQDKINKKIFFSEDELKLIDVPKLKILKDVLVEMNIKELQHLKSDQKSIKNYSDFYSKALSGEQLIKAVGDVQTDLHFGGNEEGETNKAIDNNLKPTNDNGRIKTSKKALRSLIKNFYNTINAIGRNSRLTTQQRLDAIHKEYQALSDKGDILQGEVVPWKGQNNKNLLEGGAVQFTIPLNIKIFLRLGVINSY